MLLIAFFFFLICHSNGVNTNIIDKYFFFKFIPTFQPFLFIVLIHKKFSSL